jgi:adenine-specific DNA methylase
MLDFISDFASWQASNLDAFVQTATGLTEAAHRALGNGHGGRPLVIDPFAGGGSIPLEAIRVGADVFSSDLNPVAVTLERALLEFIPRYGSSLATAFRQAAARIRERAVIRLKNFYPVDSDGGVPLLYLGARTIRCEGPGCGAEIPLLRSLWLVKKSKRGVALRIVPRPDSQGVDFEVIAGGRLSDVGAGTVRGGAATCPVCGFTTPKAGVRSQLRDKRGGASSARIIAVATVRSGETGRRYKLPTEVDHDAARAAAEALSKWTTEVREKGGPSPVPEEKIPVEKVWKNNPIRVHLYGNVTWADLFTPRQSLALAVFAEEIRNEPDNLDPHMQRAVATLLALALDRVMVRCTANCVWDATSECIMQIFNQGQALPARWEFAEMNPTIDDGSGWQTSIEYIADVIEQWPPVKGCATVSAASATAHPLPDDAADLLFTDPPYYDAVPYAKLSDFFYVWLKRALGSVEPDIFSADVTPKLEECVVDLAVQDVAGNVKDAAFFERTMTSALQEGRRVIRPSGLGVVVFAHKSTAGWEAQLKAMLDAGWTITASWPIDTESENRLRAQNSAALASSVHLVCRPLENVHGELRRDKVGDWRAVLEELPRRIKDWLPRLATEGVVGADAIFACLGPALEVFSRYSRVEKISGERVLLREYLEHVWAAVSKEALSMIFHDADTAGLEADARVTAMWLWTLARPAVDAVAGEEEQDKNSGGGDQEDDEALQGPVLGFGLEFDAARKITQGLGARLEELAHLIEVKGDKARLLAVPERAKHLFGKTEGVPSAKVAKTKQIALFADLEEAAEAQGWGDLGAPTPGTSTLDRVQQAMLLFGSGRSEAMKRFLIDQGVGSQPQFWKLAQSLSALYPGGSDEKRWVDGVLARKKGLGFG